MARVDPALKYLYKEDSIKDQNRPSNVMKAGQLERGDLAHGRRKDGPDAVTRISPPAAQLMPSRAESGSSERFTAAVANVRELGQSLDSLERLLLGKAVYVDEEVYANASVIAQQTRKAKAQERRIKALEREVDAAVAAAGHARAEKKQAEAAQHAAEARTKEFLQELDDTTQVFKLQAEELRTKQEQLQKKYDEIHVLKGIIEALRHDKQGKKIS